MHEPAPGGGAARRDSSFAVAPDGTRLFVERQAGPGALYGILSADEEQLRLRQIDLRETDIHLRLELRTGKRIHLIEQRLPGFDRLLPNADKSFGLENPVVRLIYL